MTHLGTSLVQSTCAQPQPYVQSPSPVKDESREKGQGSDIIYPTPLLTKHVKFSGKVRTTILLYVRSDCECTMMKIGRFDVC